MTAIVLSETAEGGLVSYDEVLVVPSSPAEIPVNSTLRTRFDATITMPVSAGFLGPCTAVADLIEPTSAQLLGTFQIKGFFPVVSTYAPQYPGSDVSAND